MGFSYFLLYKIHYNEESPKIVPSEKFGPKGKTATIFNVAGGTKGDVDGAPGTYTPPTPDFPDAGSVLSSDTVDGNAGTLVLPDPRDLRYGTTVGATIGKLKMNCRNMAGNWDGTNYTGGSSPLHTIEDYNAVGGGGSIKDAK